MSYEHFQNKTRPPAGTTSFRVDHVANTVEKKGSCAVCIYFFVRAYLNYLAIFKGNLNLKTS